MNPNDLIRNQQLNKLRGAAMQDDVPAGLSKKPDLSKLHYTDNEDNNLNSQNNSSLDLNQDEDEEK